MRPTLQYIEQKFDYYNALCFNGQLPRPQFMLTQRDSAVGRSRHCVVLVNDKHVEEHIIEISIRRDLPEIEYIDTLVHEMIHYYIALNNIQDDAPHGTVFHSIMNRITQTYGIRITIEYNEADNELIARETDRYRYVCVVEKNNGEMTLAIVIRDKVFQYWNSMSTLSDVKSVKWYVSNRAIFEKFPARIKPAFVPLSPEKIQSYLTGALELENTGTVIRPRE